MSEHEWRTQGQYIWDCFMIDGKKAMHPVAEATSEDFATRIAREHNDNARLRELLANLVHCGPEVHYDTVKHLHGCVDCGGGLNSWGELLIHKPDCPWLLASRWLEEHPDA